MAFERYVSREWKNIPSSMTTETRNYDSSFDCNICFDFALEPVVTLCGHLYCWPCIYKWLHVQSSSLVSDERPQCPVCRADICPTTLVPLYGRGQTQAPSEQDKKASCSDIFIPPRPRAFGAQALMSASSSSSQGGHHRQHVPYHYPHHHSHQQVLNLSTTLTPQGFHHPVAGMVYTTVFGNPENLYAYPNSYQQMGSNSPRLRRQVMQADKSLNRISMFLFCCFVLCLIVF